MVQLDIIQVAQSVPQQFIPYIILFGLAFFLISFTKISWKIRLVISLIASVGINLYMPTLLSPLTLFINGVASIGASLILIAVGFVVGRKHVAVKLPQPSKQSSELIRNLEMQKANLMQQFNSVRGDIKREQQVMARINEIDNRLRNERTRLGLPV
jgi:hypothetical protein